MEVDKKAQEKALFGRVFSVETLLFCVGGVCIVYGVSDGMKVMPIFFGLCIVIGRGLLHLVRKRDWDAHWAEQEMVRKAHEARMAEERERGR